MKTEKKKTRVPKRHTGLNIISFLTALCILATIPFLAPSPVSVEEYSDMLVIPTPEPTPEPTPVPTPAPTPEPVTATLQEPVPTLFVTEEPEITIATLSEATASEPAATPAEALTAVPVVTPVPTPEPTPAPTAVTTTTPAAVTAGSTAVTVQSVPVYKEASVQSAKFTTLKKGTSIHVYDVSGKWAAVKAGSNKGYVPLVALTAAPVKATPRPTAEPTPSPTPVPTPVPTPTPAPLRVQGEVFDRRGDGSMIVRLPMDDFSGGSKPDEEGYSVVSDRQKYEDESITVETYQFKYNYTVYSVADVTIADASQLRTAIAGTPSSAARASMVKIADRVNAVVALNGDYYADRKGGYIVRQGQCLSHGMSSACDLLVIDYDGNFHCIKASEKKEALEALKGNIYQCFNFGPVLIRNGEKQDIPSVYDFGINYMNPRAAIGQLGDLHYVLVVASGRLDNSLSITGETMRDIMYKLGCTEAYNLDGGASAEMVYRGKIYSLLTPSGERGLYDIIYFASTAGKEK